jgi:photosystem II stability/assembly factor-like uncharacterized protein
MRQIRAVAGALLILGAAASAYAQSWLPVGPPGGDVRDLAADPRDPRRMYLGTADGILYRSDDSGARWQRLSPGFPQRGHSLDDIVVDPRGVVLIGFWDVHGSGGGVARSVDGGKTFTLLPGIAGQGVRALAVAPSNPDILVAGTLTGVFRSLDGGRTWQRLTPAAHPDLRNFDSIAIDPRDPSVIYAGTWHLPWKTVDGGRTWSQVNVGMIDDSDVMTMTLDQLNPQVVWATACSGIYRSADGALRWSKIRGIPSSARRTRAFAQSPDNLNLFFAGTTEGLWVSEDGGVTWRLSTQKDLVVNAVTPLPGGTVVLGTDGAGVIRSTDGGQSWFASNQGFSERFVSRTLFDRAGRRVLAGIWGDRSHGGVFVAPGPRGPWSRLGTGLEGREVLALALSGTDVLAGTDDGVFVAEAGRWRRLPMVVDRVDLHPRVHDLVALSDQRVLVASSKGLLRTADGGRTWQRPLVGPTDKVNALALSPGDLNVVVAAAPLGFFRSGDGGATWVQVSAGLGDVEAHTVAFLPSDERVLFATTTRGLFRSPDQGSTWIRVTGGIPFTDITGLALHPDGRTMYASDFTWGGIYRTVDAGRTWERMPTEGLASDKVWTLGLDPAAPERLLAASPTGGLHLLVPPPAAPTTAGGGGSP